MLNIVYLDTCLPDYFRGFSGHVYAVPVSHDSTYRTILADVTEAVNREEIFGATDPDYEEIYESLKLLFGCIEDKDAIFAPYLEPYADDSQETVYAYFGVTKTC